MKRTIEVVESPGMKLKNAIVKEIPIDGADVFEELKRMDSVGKVLGFHLKSPHVIKRWLDVEDGHLIERASLIIQCHGTIPKDLPPDLEYIDEIHSGRSLFVDFTGSEDALEIIPNKIRVYAYENDLELTGEAYTVFLDKEESVVHVNAHYPIDRKE